MNRGLALILAVGLAGCGSEGTAPVIDRVSPNAAPAGDTVDITGKRFCGPDAADANADGTCVTPPAGLVRIAEARAPVQMWTHTQITVTVPTDAEAGGTTVVVERDGETSNSKFFTVE